MSERWETSYRKALWESSRALREWLMEDYARPKYHFLCPEDDARPGDPNAAFYAGGRYHLMYLYKCCSDSFRYGHMSSPDLVHWERHPDALFPDSLDGGIYSGGAFVDDDETVYIAYSDLPTASQKKRFNGVRIAFSKDKENHYVKWEKIDPEAVISTAPGIRSIDDGHGGLLHLCSADPSNIWKEDGVYYLQVGNLAVMMNYGKKEKEKGNPFYEGDYTDLFASRDMIHWDYLHRFYDFPRNPAWTDETEDDMCPSFLPLPSSPNGGPPSGRFLQLFISHKRGAQYYIGSYDSSTHRFTPEKHGRMSYKDHYFHAPEALMAPDGRQIMWGWMAQNRPDEAARFGWCGVYSLPRSLWLREDGGLGIAPAEEIKKLRCGKRPFEGARSDCCEIEMDIKPNGATRAGVTFYASENGEEYSRFYYDAAAQELVYEGVHPGSDLPHSEERAPFSLSEGETLHLDLFLDASAAEVFANGRQAISRRAYLSDRRSDRISFYTDGDAELLRADLWEMAPVFNV